MDRLWISALKFHLDQERFGLEEMGGIAPTGVGRHSHPSPPQTACLVTTEAPHAKALSKWIQLTLGDLSFTWPKGGTGTFETPKLIYLVRIIRKKFQD